MYVCNQKHVRSSAANFAIIETGNSPPGQPNGAITAVDVMATWKNKNGLPHSHAMSNVHYVNGCDSSLALPQLYIRESAAELKQINLLRWKIKLLG